MRYSLICASALLLYSALTIPSLFFFCIFLYLVPLFYLVIDCKGILSYKDGVLWAIVLYLFHWYDVAILAHTQGHGLARYGVMPFLVLCSAVYAGAWFWIACRLNVITKKPAVVWISTTWLYTIVMQRASFWILGRMQGYPFSFPLIPLARYPQTLYTLRYAHPHLLLLLLIMGSWGIAAVWHAKRSYRSRLAAFGLYAPFIIGFFVGVNSEPPAQYHTIGYVSPCGLSEHLLERAGELAECCNTLGGTHTAITHIVTPESTLAIAFNAHPELHEALTHTINDENLILVLGAHRKEEGCSYNSCYYIQDCLIIRRYDKSLTMPFTEYIPNIWSNFESINRIFLHNKIIMNSNSKKGVIFSDFIPLICSDYYLDWYDEPQKTAVPLLLLVNETWFRGQCMKNLMQLTARYGAMARRQDVIYVAHQEGIYFSRDGGGWLLLQ